MRTFLTTTAFLLAISIIYAAAASRAQTVVIAASDCAALARHLPEPDVAYSPGVDAEGRAVEPADIGGGIQLAMPREFEIPITLDLQKRLGIPPDPAQYQTDQFRIGTVTYKDGRAWFNGQPLQDEDTARLSALCQQQMRTR